MPGGYHIVTEDGRVASFGSAVGHGDLAGVSLRAPIVDAASTPTGAGYWLLGADGAVFTFGDASYRGGASEVLRPGGATVGSAVAMAATPTGDGYWVLAADGGVFTYGDAPMWGSLLGLPPVEPGVEWLTDAEIPVAWLPDETAIDIVRVRSGYLVVTSRRRLALFLDGDGSAFPLVSTFRGDAASPATVAAGGCFPLKM